jgi:hypothetical protein
MGWGGKIFAVVLDNLQDFALIRIHHPTHLHLVPDFTI